MKLGKTIRHQIIILTILVLITSLLGSLFIAHRAFSETITKNTFSKLANDVTYVSQKVLQKTDALNETLLLDYAQNTLIRITLMDEKGDVIFDSDYKTERMDNHFYREELEKARKDGFGTAKRYSATEDVDVLYYARFLGSDSAIPYVRVSSQLSQLKQYNAIYRNLFFSGLLFLLIATLIITLLSIRAITHPLEELHAVVEEYIQGNLFARSAVESPKELALLSSTLNHMAEQLQTTIEEIESQKQLYSSILHSMSEGIVSLDRKNIIMEANKAATELLIGDRKSVV